MRDELELVQISVWEGNGQEFLETRGDSVF